MDIVNEFPTNTPSKPYGSDFCSSCQRYVRWTYTPGGLTVCPSCGYSPTLGTRISASTVSTLPKPSEGGFRRNY